MLVFCTVPLASSLGNDLGWYDGLSGVLYQLTGDYAGPPAVSRT